MGLLNPIQVQFIKRPDSAKGEMVYKWPDENIRMHTQLTVQPDESALFVKEGQVKGVLSEGMHTLDGANIPFIGGLINLGTGGNYFVSELYFVSIHEFVNQLFGGPVDNVTDPDTGLAVGLRCYGEYSVKAIDPQKLIINLVGTTNVSSMEEIRQWVSSQLLKIIREVVVSHIVSNDTTKKWDILGTSSEDTSKWEILGIASRNQEIEEESVGATNKLLESYGLEITRLGNINVSINDQDAQTLKQLKRDMIYGNNMNAADAALKLGAAKGFEEGNMNPGLFAAGLGFGYAASNSAVQGTMQNQGEITCKNCNTNNPQGSKFCSNCGNKLQ